MDLKLVLRRFMAAHSGKVTRRRRPECLADHLVTLQCIERNIKSAREVADSGDGDRIGVQVADISMEGVTGIEVTANSIETGGDQTSHQQRCRPNPDRHPATGRRGSMPRIVDLGITQQRPDFWKRRTLRPKPSNAMLLVKLLVMPP